MIENQPNSQGPAVELKNTHLPPPYLTRSREEQINRITSIKNKNKTLNAAEDISWEVGNKEFVI